MTQCPIPSLLVKLHLLFLIYFPTTTVEAAPEPAFSLRHHPPTQASNFADQRTKDNLLSPRRDACRPPPPRDAPPACAAHASLTRVNCRGLLAATAPLGPEDALAEAQPRRPCDRPDSLLPQYPGSTPAARSWADSLWGRG